MNYDNTPYASMSAERQVQYVGDFTRWYANRQVIVDAALTNNFDADSVAAFDAGVMLLRPWPFGERFQDSVNTTPRRLCVPRLMYLTDLVKCRIKARHTTPSQPPRGEERKDTSGGAKHGDRSPVATAATSQGAITAATSQGAATATPSQGAADLTPSHLHTSTPSHLTIPTTGRLHLDQIAYLLSPALAERVRNLKTILDTRDVESNTAKQLAQMGKPEAEIAPHSQAAVKAQEDVTDIYARVDNELAEYVATYHHIRTHKAEPGAQETAFKNALSNLEEASKPFGSLDNLIVALTPYYEKCNKDGRIDRSIEQDFKVYGANGANKPNEPNEPTPTYDPKDYKRIWTYVSRQDVAHTEKRLRKMRECIDEAKAASMPNIEAMETFYQKEAELVLAEQQKRLDDGEPTLL